MNQEPVLIKGVVAFPNPNGNREIRFIDAFYHDLFRSMKNGQPFFMMESTPSLVNWHPVNKLPMPRRQELSSIQAVDGQEIIGTTEKRTEPEPEETTLPPVESTLPEITAEPVPETDENGEIITTEAVSEEVSEEETEE